MYLIEQIYTNETIPHYIAIMSSGVGLGMLIVYYFWSKFIREWQNGKITVQSEDGKRINIIGVDFPLLTKKIYYPTFFVLLGFNISLIFFSKLPY